MTHTRPHDDARSMSRAPPPPPPASASADAAAAADADGRTSGSLRFKPMTTQPATVAPRSAPRPLLLEWALAGSATMSACLFTNPMETIKTRMQVQGELQRTAARGGGPPPPKLYTSFPQAFWHVARTEGIRGLQGGLAPSLLYQLTMNGTRLGLYEPLKRLVTRIADGESPSGPDARLGAHLHAHRPPNFLHNVLAAAGSGCIAAFIGSPFFLVKVRLQVQSKNKAVVAPILAAAPTPGAAVLPSAVAAAAGGGAPAVVGAQHAYTSAWSGLRSIYSADGIPGLFRGASASMLRVSVGSVIQLSSYDTVKFELMRRTGWEDSVRVHVGASLLSGFLVAVGMHPFDVVSTRMYNQPVVGGKGQLYSGMLDCVAKTVRTEGLPGLYKGFVAHYFRLGPHTLLTFVIWEQIKAAAARAGI